MHLILNKNVPLLVSTVWDMVTDYLLEGYVLDKLIVMYGEFDKKFMGWAYKGLPWKDFYYFLRGYWDLILAKDLRKRGKERVVLL